MTLDAKVKSGLMLIAVLIIATKITLWLVERWLEFRAVEKLRERLRNMGMTAEDAGYMRIRKGIRARKERAAQ